MGTIEQSLDLGGEIKRKSQTNRSQSDKRPIGGDRVPEASRGALEDFIDDMLVVLKKHNRSKKYENKPHNTHFRAILHKGIDIVDDSLLMGGNKMGEDKVFEFGRIALKAWQPDKEGKNDKEQRDYGKDSVKAQRGGVYRHIGVVKSLPPTLRRIEHVRYNPIFPGFRMLFGSKAFLMARKRFSSCGVKASFIKGALDNPMPCSPLSVPPISMVILKISSIAL